MNIKIICLMCSCLLVATSMFAQKKQRKQRPSKIKVEQVERIGIDFYDGSFLLGDLISDDNKVVKIMAFGDDLIEVEHGLIKSLKKESDGISFTKNGRYNIDRGVFVNVCPLGFGVDFDGGSFASHIIVGYTLNNRYAVGVGTGFEFHSDEISRNWFDYGVIPLFAYGKYNINLKGPRCYVYGKLGYADSIDPLWDNDDISTNVYSQIGLGVAFPAKWAGRLTLEMGRTFMGVKGTINRTNWQTNTPIIQEFTQLFMRNTFKIGIAFNQ